MRLPHSFIREAKDPSLFTVVFEDSAALLGLVFAFCGVFFGHMFNNPYLDGGASVLIGLLLCTVAIILLRETKSLIIGEGLRAPEVQEVREVVRQSPKVVECGRILSLYLGPADLLVTIDVTFESGITSDEVMLVTDEIEGRIVARFPQATRIFIESESLKFARRGAVEAQQ
jgi:divalent metal cation (Fe/Co/Zn/Cd) transporter